MQSLAHGSACGEKEQESSGVPATGRHALHLLGWAGAQLERLRPVLLSAPPLLRAPPEYWCLWIWMALGVGWGVKYPASPHLLLRKVHQAMFRVDS